MAMREPGAGELDKRVQIRTWLDAPDGGVGMAQQYVTQWECWAKLEPISGASYWGSRQVNEQVTDMIIVRQVAGKSDPASITGQHVIDYKGQRWACRRVTDINGAGRFTAVEAELLGPAT